MLSNSVFYVPSDVKITLKTPQKILEISNLIALVPFSWTQLSRIASKNTVNLTLGYRKKIINKFPTLPPRGGGLRVRENSLLFFVFLFETFPKLYIENKNWFVALFSNERFSYLSYLQIKTFSVKWHQVILSVITMNRVIQRQRVDCWIHSGYRDIPQERGPGGGCQVWTQKEHKKNRGLGWGGRVEAACGYWEIVSPQPSPTPGCPLCLMRGSWGWRKPTGERLSALSGCGQPHQGPQHQPRLLDRWHTNLPW